MRLPRSMRRRCPQRSPAPTRWSPTAGLDCYDHVILEDFRSLAEQLRYRCSRRPRALPFCAQVGRHQGGWRRRAGHPRPVWTAPTTTSWRTSVRTLSRSHPQGCGPDGSGRMGVVESHCWSQTSAPLKRAALDLPRGDMTHGVAESHCWSQTLEPIKRAALDVPRGDMTHGISESHWSQTSELP